MTKLYLDIDGVLLSRGKLTRGLVEFLSFVTERFDCYWLTTHCDGDAKTAFLYLVGKVPSEAIPSIEKFKPTKWKSLKTEAIDFTNPFVWIDDNLFDSERRMLEAHGALDSFIHINLRSNPNQLLDVMKELS